MGRKEILEEKEIGVRTAPKMFVCGAVVGDEDVSAITDESSVTGDGGKK